MSKEKWVKQEHYLYTMYEKEKENSAFKGMLKDYAPELQYTKKHLSIISPSKVSFGKWELFDGKEIYRFDSLKETQKFGDNLLINLKKNVIITK